MSHNPVRIIKILGLRRIQRYNIFVNIHKKEVSKHVQLSQISHPQLKLSEFLSIERKSKIPGRAKMFFSTNIFDRIFTHKSSRAPIVTTEHSLSNLPISIAKRRSLQN